MPALLLLGALAACGQDALGPETGLAPSTTAAFLLETNEFVRVLDDYTDEDGSSVLIAEYAAGIYVRRDGSRASVASVVIKSVIPASGGGGDRSDGPCVTSTVERIDTTAGWSASVDKEGGCGEEIAVELENRETDQVAEFEFEMDWGRTRIVHGAVEQD